MVGRRRQESRAAGSRHSQNVRPLNWKHLALPCADEAGALPRAAGAAAGAGGAARSTRVSLRSIGLHI